jgi:hypothetical protein
MTEEEYEFYNELNRDPEYLLIRADELLESAEIASRIYSKQFVTDMIKEARKLIDEAMTVAAKETTTTY